MPKVENRDTEVLLIFLLSWLVLPSTAAVNQTETLPGCQAKCGNVNIPYPFGIGRNCSIAGYTTITCNTTFNPPKPFLLGRSRYEVADISPTEIRIKNDVATSCHEQYSAARLTKDYGYIRLTGSPYTFSSTKNKLTAIGCDTLVVTLADDTHNYTSGCISVCDEKEDVVEGTCSGNGCCQTSIPKGLNEFYISVGTIYNYSKVWSFDPCGAAFLGEQDKYTFKASDFYNTTSLVDIPIVINFAVDNKTCKAAKRNSTAYACKENSYCIESVDDTGYLCNCSAGYQGNPYLKQGCQDVNECEDPNNNPCKGICTNTRGSYNCSCADDSYGDGRKNGTGCIKKAVKPPVLQLSLGIGLGLLFLLVGGSGIFFTLKKRELSKLRQKFFQQNGGLLLKQHISSHEESHISQLLDVGVVNEEKTEQVYAVVELAKRCLTLKGEKRPSMKEVAAELERLSGFERQSWVQTVQQSNGEHKHADEEYEQGDLYSIPVGSYSLNDTSGYYSMEKPMLHSMNVPR
ncbi:Wall-associated receptor kinase [Thalictrum thalictroides]|uniref:Wall-associated receptor kinase n=1 Tax=Thalictrum thalictroides TaxID=46969 RepID=A0A7J6WR21_THATH|nr:Wall-associated receptor kinase [Thalictrum thalictroides]